jgi:glycosyltransferase involved in cell wall biosynthesis
MYRCNYYARGMIIHLVIPAYKVRLQLSEVVTNVGPEVSKIWVVDDACPEDSCAELVRKVDQSRIFVLRNQVNLGVGGATKVGMRAALESGADIVVKIDGDGQMNPSDIPRVCEPIFAGRADFAKGNRFEDLVSLRKMPLIRIIGNAGLSILTKFSTGYWSVNDPTNGFIAIRSSALRFMDLDKISNRYFFESDLLFRLRLLKAVVVDVPIATRYGDEKSNLSVVRSLVEFPWLHLRNFFKRLTIQYLFKEWSFASLELIFGALLIVFGVSFGLASFVIASEIGSMTTPGQVTLSALAIILGFQLLLSFLAFDIQSEPKEVRFR